MLYSFSVGGKKSDHQGARRAIWLLQIKNETPMGAFLAPTFLAEAIVALERVVNRLCRMSTLRSFRRVQPQQLLSAEIEDRMDTDS